jgi:plasmid maintenance system antidote protein VapI
MTSDPRSANGQAPARPGPGEVKDQLRRLRAEGGTYRSIAAAAGLAPATIHDLAAGRRQATPSTTRALQKVSSGALRRARVDAGGTRLRLRALHVMGHGSARIARALDVREMTIRQVVRGDAPTVSSSLRDAVIDLYDAWWDKRAPERTRAERAAATAARRRAIAGNWCAGAGLDDDELDTPGYKPRSNWKPATGTGVAPDIHPPARPPNGKRRTGKGAPASRNRTTGERPWG